jgi:hypothetical protein
MKPTKEVQWMGEITMLEVSTLFPTSAFLSASINQTRGD